MIWVHTWLVMLSHVVMSVIQVFPSLMVLTLACLNAESVCLPSLEM
jgi:hypothetical protein